MVLATRRRPAPPDSLFTTPMPRSRRRRSRCPGSAHGSLAPTAVGVFRDVEAPVYDDLMETQLQQALALPPPVDGDPLAALLAGSDTWTVA